MIRLLWALLLVIPGSGLKIGVFDSSANAFDTNQVALAVNNAPNIEVEQVIVTTSVIDSARTAIAGGAVAFIGLDTADEIYAIEKEMGTQQTPLVTTALRQASDSFDEYSNFVVSSTQRPISEYALKISEYAALHNNENIAVIHDGSVDSLDFATQLGQYHDKHPSINRLLVHELPVTASGRNALFEILKENYIEVVTISSTNTQQIKALLEAASTVKELHVGRVWIAVQFHYDPEFETEVLIEHLMQLRHTQFASYDAGLVLASALSSFTTNPPNPWNLGDALRRVVASEMTMSPLGFYICENRDWGASSIDTWPLGEDNKKTEVGTMEGITFKVLFKISDPYFYLENTAYTGFIADFEARMRQTLGYSVIADYTTDSYDKTLTYVDQYDIIFGDFTISQQRQALYDFTQPFLETSDSMIMRAPSEGALWWQFLKPFSIPVWCCWMLVWFVGGITFFNAGTEDPFDEPEVVSREEKRKALLEKMIAKHKKKEQEKAQGNIANETTSVSGDSDTAGEKEGKGCCGISQRYWNYVYSSLDAMYLSFATIFGGEASARSPSRKFIMIGFAVANTIFVSTYTAQLTALLAEKDKSYFVDTFSQIVNHEVSMSEVVIPDGTSNQARFEETMNIASDLQNKGYVVAENEHDMIDEIRAGRASVGIYDAIWTRWVATSAEHCDIVVHGDKWNKFGFGFALPKSSPYTPIFTEAVLEIKADYDFITQLEDKYFVGPCPEVPTTDDEVQQVGTSAFTVIWSFTASVYFLALCAKACEHRADIEHAKDRFDQYKKNEKAAEEQSANQNPSEGGNSPDM